MQDFSNFLALFQVIMANPGKGILPQIALD